MTKKHESTWNIDELTDAEIYGAIRDLEPDSVDGKQLDDSIASVICVALFMFLLGCLGLIWLRSL